MTLVLGVQLLVALYLAHRSIAYTRKKRAACTASGAAAVPECATSTIPKIIHQSYKSLAELPEAWKHVPGAWSSTHPDYEYRFWSDAANRALVEEHYPWFLKIYDAYPRDIQRADAARYFAVYHHGGVYADMDIVPVRGIGELLCRHMRKGTEIMVAETPNAGLTNSFFAAQPQSRVLEIVVWRLSRSTKPLLGRIFPYFNVMLSTGSTFFWRTVAGLPQQDVIAVLPFGEWKPCSVCDGPICRGSGDPVVQHIEGSSWHRWDGQLLLFLFCRWEVLCWTVIMITSHKLLAPALQALGSTYQVWMTASAAVLMLLLVCDVRRNCSI